MDIEQLRLVLETLKDVGHEAGSLATLWLWLKFGGSILHTLLVSAGIAVAGFFIYKGVMAASGAAGSEAFIKEMRDRLGVGSPGILPDGERNVTQQRLREMIIERNTQKASK